MLHLEWFKKKSFQMLNKILRFAFYSPSSVLQRNQHWVRGERKKKDSRTFLPQKKQREQAGKILRGLVAAQAYQTCEGQDLRGEKSFFSGDEPALK